MNISQQLIADLERMVEIPSIGALPEHSPDLRRSADLVASLIAEAGCEDVRVIDGPNAPAVVARFPAPEGAPTICFYSHHDVQPIGDLSVWQRPPLEVTEDNGRLYGRGTADDKGGIAAHIATMRALGGKPPVGVTIFIEGEEEVGSPYIGEFLENNAELIRADAFVILDAGNWAPGEPAFTTALRGVCDAIVEVETLDHAIHSGQFGGPVPDALTTLCRLLATLNTDDGDVAVEGLRTSLHFDVDYDEESFRADAGLLDGVQVIGTGTLADRMWAKPSVTVIGIDTVSVEQSSNTLLPSARARVSLRVPPGMPAVEALDALEAHLLSHAPWGAHVKVIRGSAGDSAQVSTTGPLVQAGLAAYEKVFGTPARLLGMGGAIPLVSKLGQVFPDAEFLLTGLADPDARMHSPNESVVTEDLVHTVEAQVEFLKSAAHLRVG